MHHDWNQGLAVEVAKNAIEPHATSSNGVSLRHRHKLGIKCSFQWTRISPFRNSTTQSTHSDVVHHHLFEQSRLAQISASSWCICFHHGTYLMVVHACGKLVQKLTCATAVKLHAHNNLLQFSLSMPMLAAVLLGVCGICGGNRFTQKSGYVP